MTMTIVCTLLCFVMGVYAQGGNFTIDVGNERGLGFVCIGAGGLDGLGVVDSGTAMNAFYGIGFYGYLDNCTVSLQILYNYLGDVDQAMFCVTNTILWGGPGREHLYLISAAGPNQCQDFVEGFPATDPHSCDTNGCMSTWAVNTDSVESCIEKVRNLNRKVYCESNQYIDVNATQHCKNYTTCEGASPYMAIAPSITSDRVCSKNLAGGCLYGYFAKTIPTATKLAECARCTICKVHQETKYSCNGINDAVCVNITTPEQTDFDHDPLSSGDWAAIGVGILITLVIVVCLLYGLKKKVKQTQELKEQESLNERLLADSKTENQRMQSAWEIDPDDIIMGVIPVASGSFGTVFDGKYGGNRVAIKVLREPLDDSDQNEDFQSECDTYKSIRHANLVLFYGAGWTIEGKPFMVMEFMSLGSLKSVLADTNRDIVWSTRVQIAFDIAKGMSYLHKSDIVHRDLKSDNCLLNSELVTKVADFGSSKLLSTHSSTIQDTSMDSDVTNNSVGQSFTATMTAMHGTLLWTAPEIFAKKSRYGPEIDVYSFGIIMWELATRRLPWDEIEEEEFIVFIGKFYSALEAGRRPQLSPEIIAEHPEFVAIMKLCWAQEPENRLSFDLVAHRLK